MLPELVGISSGRSGRATSFGVGPNFAASGSSLPSSKPYKRAAFSPSIARTSAGSMAWKVCRVTGA
jgi:hypothetical protein